ncbi:hypothetical protein [Trebonia sp.]|uniref:hypothetical protein n=1 Tax=Trebonia sp. TaxID=2767075 RepID=UPI002630ED90|nr:hypothetical protein [Trebonia sp.]
MQGLANAASATTNIVSPLRRLGLLNEDGGLTARGNKWRVDASYADACQEILDDVYPSELASLTDATGAPDKTQVSTWFEHKGFGGVNARQMTSTYLMIAEKMLPTATPPEGKAKKASRPPAGRKTTPATVTQNSGETNSAVALPTQLPETQPTSPRQPMVHLDIQIHIPADATLEQIDQIFASMAKHLYQK